jgi:radical SAM protein with 4Fe4S-binding SPASM domain
MSNFYCAAPWRGLHINPVGNVKTCCSGNPNMLGNISDQTIESILNGPKLKEIRSALRQGQSHPYCSNCLNREKAGGDSERLWHNRINEGFDTSQAGLDYEFPTLVDVRWNTTCNQSCNYCGSKQSSKWADILKIPVNINTRHYYEHVCDFLAQHQTHIQEVALVGGEPFLLKENSRLLEVIPADCMVTIITNLNVELKNNPIFQKLQTRSRVGWSISFDNILDRFEYVRYGGDWSLILRNLDLVQELMQSMGHWGGIHAVYNLYSATRLHEFMTFARDRGLTIQWQNLDSPTPLDPRRHGSAIARLCAQEIDRILQEFTLSDADLEFFNTARDHYLKINHDGTDMLSQLQKFIVNIEQYHPDQAGQFARLWPEFTEILWPQN